MRVIISKNQLKILVESELKDLLSDVKFIVGDNIDYSTIRRIGKYINDKKLIDTFMVESISNLLRNDNADCDSLKYDVILDVTDSILYFYEDNWSVDIEGNLVDVFDQIRDFLYDMYGELITSYCEQQID